MQHTVNTLYNGGSVELEHGTVMRKRKRSPESTVDGESTASGCIHTDGQTRHGHRL